MSDIQSLYPHKGVTDAIIDFFVRYIPLHRTFQNILILTYIIRILLPTSATSVTASALAYTGITISTKLQHSDSEMMKKFTNTNGPMDLDLFPCKVQ